MRLIVPQQNNILAISPDTHKDINKMNEPDRYRLLSFDVVTTLFCEEVAWMVNNRYKLMEYYPDYLDLLSKSQFSHWHMYQVKVQMDNEAKEKKQQEEDAKKKVRDGASLTGGYTRQ
jgi:thioredoxin-related protein